MNPVHSFYVSYSIILNRRSTARASYNPESVEYTSVKSVVHLHSTPLYVEKQLPAIYAAADFCFDIDV